MNLSNKLLHIFQQLILLTTVMLTASCMTTSSSSSSGIPSPASIPSSSPSSSPSSTPSSSPPSTPSAQSGKSAGDQSRKQAQRPGQGDSSADASSKQASNDEGSGDRKNSTEGNLGKREKTDDEILAEALKEFDNRTGTGDTQQQDTADQTIAGLSSTDKPEDGQDSLTDGEKSKQLNNELDEKFAKFDDMMLGERDTITKRTNEEDSGKYGIGNAGSDGTEDGPLQTAMASPPPPRSGGIAGNVDSESVRPPPSDIGSGEDDDIIARQLREAAMKEQDPELREKLWDEYRKYKRDAS